MTQCRRERVHNWPGGKLPIIRVLDFGEAPEGSGVAPAFVSEEELGEREAVPFGDALALVVEPPPIMPLRTPAGEPLAEVEVGIVGCESGIVAIRARGRSPLTGTLLRQIAPTKLLDFFLPGRVVRVVRHEDGRVVGELYIEAGGKAVGVGLLREELDEELEQRGPRRQTLTDSFLREVADVYRDARAQGVSTQKAIQRRWPTSAANARRWVGLARKGGFLGAAPSPRMAGEQRKDDDG